MTTQPQPLVSVTTPTTRYGASSFRIKDLTPPAPGQSPYYETDKIKALAVYAECENTYEVERQTGIPRETVRNWIENEDSADLIGELRASLRYNEGWRLSKLFSRTLDKVAERLEQGDPFVTKSGQVVYRPIAYRDLVVGMSITMDKWMAISGAISNEGMLLGRMDDLSKQLTVMGGALKSTPPSPPPDGTPIEEPRGENLIG